ncbi:MAG TPA: sigma-70 family RNA polymerase sigma factor [Chthoniobacterales bacterium]|jgi:RNA polymerase sigma-70 factor (ECF subfamily)
MESSGLPLQSSGKEALQTVPDESDQALVTRMNHGDDHAFEIFYDRFAPGLFSMVFAILRDQKESEDVLQEAFLQMWKRVATYDATRSSLFTWAVMISRHKAIDRLRSRQRQTRLAEAAANEQPERMTAPSADRADNVLARSDDRDRVLAALGRLSEAQREALDLAFFSGLTQTEISEKLGTPLGTIKARIRRGLLALRDMLGKVST